MAKNDGGFNVTVEYKEWIKNVKKRIKQSQIKASVKVNHELMDLYRDLGRDIVKKQENTKWGDGFLVAMSKDLKRAFPGMNGFSVQNLKSIRYWYKFYSGLKIGLQPVSQLNEAERMIKSIPWGHNQWIITGAEICWNIKLIVIYMNVRGKQYQTFRQNYQTHNLT